MMVESCINDGMQMCFLANSLSIKRVELFENLPDDFVTKAPVNAKDREVYVFKHHPDKNGMYAL